MAFDEAMDFYEEVAAEMGRLVSEKQKAYGDAFGMAGDFLALLYPDGIKPEQYSDMLTLVRIFDKMCRIANKKNAFGESPFRDINGYSLLAIVRDQLKEEAAKHSIIKEEAM